MALWRDDLYGSIKSKFWALCGILLWAPALSIPIQISSPYKRYLHCLCLTLKPLIFSPSSTTDPNQNHSITNPIISSSSSSSLFSAPLSTSFDGTMDDLIGSENGVFICPPQPEPNFTSNKIGELIKRRPHLRNRCSPAVPLVQRGVRKRPAAACLTRRYVDGRLILTKENHVGEYSGSGDEKLFKARRENNRLVLSLGVCVPR